MFPELQRPVGCAWELPPGGHKPRSARPLVQPKVAGRGRETRVLRGSDGLSVRCGPFIASHTGGWGLHTSGLQPEHRPADRPTCCHAPAAHLPPLAPGAVMRASRLHPRTPHWCSATVGARQVSSRQSGRPNSPPSRRDWCQGRALPGRLPSSPARHPVEPVSGVRGQAFLGGECLPHAALAPALPGGPWCSCRREAAGPGQETGTSGLGVTGHVSVFLPPPHPTRGSLGAMG